MTSVNGHVNVITRSPWELETRTNMHSLKSPQDGSAIHLARSCKKNRKKKKITQNNYNPNESE